MGPELPGAKAAAAAAAVSKFRIWKVAHFKKSNFSANGSDWSSLLTYSPKKAATGATRVAVPNCGDSNLAFPVPPSPFLRSCAQQLSDGSSRESFGRRRF
jgi:hypothetical protein